MGITLVWPHNMAAASERGSFYFQLMHKSMESDILKGKSDKNCSQFSFLTKTVVFNISSFLGFSDQSTNGVKYFFNSRKKFCNSFCEKPCGAEIRSTYSKGRMLVSHRQFIVPFYKLVFVLSFGEILQTKNYNENTNCW